MSPFFYIAAALGHTALVMFVVLAVRVTSDSSTLLLLRCELSNNRVITQEIRITLATTSVDTSYRLRTVAPLCWLVCMQLILSIAFSNSSDCCQRPLLPLLSLRLTLATLLCCRRWASGTQRSKKQLAQ
jgi:hypothetical protein